MLEGFGQVILEAMASGTPVICTDKPPMSEVIEDGGLTFKKNDPLDLAEKIIYLIKNEKKLSIMGKKAENVAKKYDWNIILNEYLEKIKLLISN